ncbi:MAG: hypothetical protein QNK23_12245 [Crocinitomicaceae bacterium]|nr:hypothetical protein [Crocinitomicaceae bacterium]
MLKFNVKRVKIIVFSIFIFSSCSEEGDLGATVGDCDEYCTVYYVAEKELMKQYEIYNLNFPDKDIRNSHVTNNSDKYEVRSWYYLINEDNDTTFVDFTCTVIYNSKKVEYDVQSLEILERRE